LQRYKPEQDDYESDDSRLFQFEVFLKDEPSLQVKEEPTPNHPYHQHIPFNSKK
jgi:hypothetical protein